MELCSQMSGDHLAGGIPVVLLIGAKDNFAEEELISSGARGRLKKPFSPRDLLEIISKLIGPSDGESPEVPAVREQLRKEGLFVEFDSKGRPKISSTKQHSALAKAMGLKTGRDGFGHTDEHGNFQNSGRRRNDEIQAGRSKVRPVLAGDHCQHHIASSVQCEYEENDGDNTRDYRECGPFADMAFIVSGPS